MGRKSKAALRNERAKKNAKEKADAAAAANANADAIAIAVVDTDPGDINNVAVAADNTHNEVDLHNENCESCGLGGELLCCSKCNLVYHIDCHRPPLDTVPPFSWACSYCVKDDILGYNETERRIASNGVDQIEAMNKQTKLKRAREAAGTDQPPEKRTRTDLSTSTSSSNSNSIDFSEGTKQHVQVFFGKDIASQREILRAMLTDQRIKAVLPPSSSVETNSTNMPTNNLSYNNVSIDFTDAASFRPIDNTAFHWYPPIKTMASTEVLTEKMHQRKTLMSRKQLGDLSTIMPI